MKKTVILFLVPFALGCRGGFEGDGSTQFSLQERSDPERDRPPVVLASASSFTCNPNAARALYQPGRRLTKIELKNSLFDLFGKALLAKVKNQIEGLPDEDSGGPSNFDPRYSREHTEALVSLFFEVGRVLQKNPASLVAYSGDCVIQENVSQACLSTLVRALALRAWRRPVSSAEVDGFLKANAAGSGMKNLHAALVGLFLNSEFLFNLRRGLEKGSEIELDSYQVASQIALSTVQSLPDTALLEEARLGRLVDSEVAQTHVLRLLRSERGQRRVLNFFRSWLHLDAVPEAPAEETAFLQDVSSPTLTQDLIQETEDFIKHLVFEKEGTFKDLLESKLAFARTQDVANLYETSVWTPGSAPGVTRSSWRQGLLHKAPFFISGDTKTNPIVRGAFLRREILCDPLANPPADLLEEIKVEFDPLLQTTREHVTEITRPGACVGCHSQINPLGFALEDIDALGRQRSVERVFKKNRVVKEHAIDSTVDNLRIDSTTLISVKDSADLIETMKKSSKPSACLARQIFRQIHLRWENLRDNGDSCLLKGMHHPLYDGSRTILETFAAALTAEVLKTKQVQ